MQLCSVSTVCAVAIIYTDRHRTSQCQTYDIKGLPGAFGLREIWGGDVVSGSVVEDDIQKGMVGKALSVVCIVK
jgi:hypothetical protein